MFETRQIYIYSLENSKSKHCLRNKFFNSWIWRFPSLENFLFGSVSLVKNVDIDKYKYSGFVISFDTFITFWSPPGKFGYNVIIFGVDTIQDPTQGLDNITWTAEKINYSVDFNVSKKNTLFMLALKWNKCLIIC